MRRIPDGIAAARARAAGTGRCCVGTPADGVYLSANRLTVVAAELAAAQALAEQPYRRSGSLSKGATVSVSGALANRDDLLQWAKTTGARSEFPRLVRRLALETSPDAVHLGFPAGTGTSAGDWDGSIRTLRGNAFVPAGLSVWELSVGEQLAKKADEDYAKRVATPDGTPTQDACYVQLILRQWTEREGWATGKAGDGRWREVRAYNVDTVEGWLESAPVTHAWLSEQLGLGPYGYRAAESWWRDWAAATTPVLPPAAIVAGRDEQHLRLTSILQGPSTLTTIRAGSIEETMAFVTACLQKQADIDAGQARSRTALVDDVVSWRRLMARTHPLVLVAVNDAVIAEAAASNIHHVIVPVVGGSARADLDLPPIDALAATAALAEAGMDDARMAEEVGRLARRSLIAMRRRLANKPELHQPKWARDPSRMIRSVVLAGRWNEHNAADTAAVASLAGADYDDAAEHLATLARDRDPLVAQVGTSWLLVAPQDAWIQTHTSFRRSDLERLATAVREVLLEVNPATELPPAERWRANVLGRTPKHSSELRGGLADTLALLSLQGDSVAGAGAITGEQWAANLVAEVLSAANADTTGQLWQSLSDVLQPLAEAAPDSFLDAVRTAARGPSPLIAVLFTDAEDSGFGTIALHSELLWALEALAWSREHFGQVLSLLARLAEVDPGGRMSNRPAASLSNILCPWHPETGVPPAARLAALDNLRRHHPEVTWQLMRSLLPSNNMKVRGAEPRFRDWKPQESQNLSITEWLSFVGEVVERLVADAGAEPERWLQLISHLDSLPPDMRERLRGELDRAVKQGMPSSTAKQLWEALRTLIAKHRDYADADWALPSEELEYLDGLAEQLVPQDSVERNAWLFARQMPDLGDGSVRGDFDRYDARLRELRSTAVAEVSRDGLEQVFDLAEAAALPSDVGVALADATADEHLDQIVGYVASDDARRSQVAWGWLVRRFVAGGWAFVDQLLSRTLAPRQEARILLATRDFPRAWQAADARGPAVADLFWRDFSPFGLGADFAHVGEATRRLSQVGRVTAALKLATLYRHSQDREQTELLMDLLLDFAEGHEDDPEVSQLEQYDLVSAFEYLDTHVPNARRNEIARLQWLFLPLLGFEPRIEALHEAVTADPSFLVQILQLLYRPDPAEQMTVPAGDEAEVSEDEPTPAQRQMAQAGYRLIRSYRSLPGANEDGTVNAAVLGSWVDGVLELASASGHRRSAEDVLGHVLANAPVGSDGRWPAEPVRELLERLQSDRTEAGLRMELLNRRGVTTRGLEDGGAQERALADKYRNEAQSLADQWPRSAAVLRALAEGYAADARREESEAERWRRGQQR